MLQHPQDDTKSPVPKKNHVILLRHCIRSTKSKVQFFEEKDSPKRDVSEFTASPMPNWNVPADFCTMDALKIMERSGKYLMNEILVDQTKLQPNRGRKTTIQLDVIADTAYRDVDTAAALAIGMADGAAGLKDSVDTIDLFKVRYDRLLFTPFQAVKNGDKYIEEPICHPTFSSDEKAEDVRNRFQTIPTPKPDLETMLNRIDELGGVGTAGPLTSLRNKKKTSVNDITFYRDEEFQGPINVLKLMAQMAFYSRAGGIKPPFLPNATVEDVYNMVSWIHYMRSVLSVDNPKSAIKGAILADTVIRELRREDDAYHSKVTILVGHDTDIDSLTTALGLRWILPPPFYQGDEGEFIATPPGSAMHFVHNIDSGTVEMSYIYPVTVTGEGSSFTHNRTGILESVPMVFRKGVKENYKYSLVKTNSTSILTSKNKHFTGVDILHNRTLAVLNKYPDAAKCYLNSIQKISSLKTDRKETSPLTNSVSDDFPTQHSSGEENNTSFASSNTEHTNTIDHFHTITSHGQSNSNEMKSVSTRCVGFGYDLVNRLSLCSLLFFMLLFLFVRRKSEIRAKIFGSKK